MQGKRTPRVMEAAISTYKLAYRNSKGKGGGLHELVLVPSLLNAC